MHARTCARTYEYLYISVCVIADNDSISHDVTLQCTTHIASQAHDVSDGKTIEVRGINTFTTDDAIEMFFESKRRSGGGPVEKVTRDTDSNVTYVTFEDPLG